MPDIFTTFYDILAQTDSNNWRTLADLHKKIHLNGSLSNSEKRAMVDALKQDTQAVIHETKTSLRSFIYREYSQATKQSLWREYKQWIKLFQKSRGVEPVDGIYGKNVFSEVVKYQKENGYRVDGILTPRILRSLWGNFSQKPQRRVEKEKSPSNSVDKEKAKDYIKTVISEKERENISQKLWVSSSSLEELVNAIIDFQKKNDLKVDGIPGTNTKEKLFKVKEKTEKKSPRFLWRRDLLPKDSVNLKGLNEHSKNKEDIKDRFFEIYGNLPWNFRRIAGNFLRSLWKKEVLRKSDPIALADADNASLVILHNGKIYRGNRELITWWWGIGTQRETLNAKWITTGKTMTGLYRFDGVRIMWVGKWWHGITWARVFSSIGRDAWMRRWHWGKSSAGCVVMSDEDAIKLAKMVKKNGNKWYGYLEGTLTSKPEYRDRVEERRQALIDHWREREIRRLPKFGGSQKVARRRRDNGNFFDIFG